MFREPTTSGSLTADCGSMLPFRAVRAASGCSGRLADEAVHVEVRDWLVADRLVDVVRGWVGQIGEEEAELAACVQLGLARRGGEGRGVAASPLLRRCVDRADPRSVWDP